MATAAAPVDLSQADMSGELLKRSDWLEEWRSRYFVLQRHDLYWCDSAQAEPSGAGDISQASLEVYSVGERVAMRIDNLKPTDTMRKPRTTLIVAAESDDIAVRWLSVLTSVCKTVCFAPEVATLEARAKQSVNVFENPMRFGSGGGAQAGYSNPQAAAAQHSPDLVGATGGGRGGAGPRPGSRRGGDPDPVIREGWLQKKATNPGKTNWRLRYFRLHKGGKLAYYTSNSKRTQDVRGTFLVSSRMRVSDFPLRPNAFVVGDTANNLFLEAPDEDARDEWMETLRECIKHIKEHRQRRVQSVLLRSGFSGENSEFAAALGLTQQMVSEKREELEHGGDAPDRQRNNHARTSAVADSQEDYDGHDAAEDGFSVDAMMCCGTAGRVVGWEDSDDEDDGSERRGAGVLPNVNCRLS